MAMPAGGGIAPVSNTTRTNKRHRPGLDGTAYTYKQGYETRGKFAEIMGSQDNNIRRSQGCHLKKDRLTQPLLRE